MAVDPRQNAEESGAERGEIQMDWLMATHRLR